MKRFVVAAVLFWPPAYCGGDGGNGGFPLRRSPEMADVKALKEEIAFLKAELEVAKAEVTAEDAKHKRTDIKKLMGDSAGGDQADQPQPVEAVVSNQSATDGMDMVVTCVTVDGKAVEMHCDVPNCHDVARNVWFSVDTGILFKRCDKHKDGVVVK